MSLLLIFTCLYTVGQPVQSKEAINNLLLKVDTFNLKYPAEQVYLHFDKPYYAAGDTMWFKGYLFNSTHAYSPLSGLLYVELLSDSSRVISRLCLPVVLGLSQGQLPLTAAEVPEGSYTIRAYTNWMQNAGEESFFHQRFYVGNAQDRPWLIKESHRVEDVAGKTSVKLNMQFNSLDKQPAGLRVMQLKVYDGKRVLSTTDAETGSDGSIDAAFALPAGFSGRQLIIKAEDKKDPLRRAVIPLKINRAEKTDLQFLPESGYLVAGLPSRVGFKAIAEDGSGADVQGKVLDDKNAEVAVIQSMHKGMGVFDLTPQPGVSYTAQLTFPDGKQQRYVLPPARVSGIVMQIDNLPGRDSLLLSISVTPDLARAGQAYYLTGLSGGVVYYAAGLMLNKPVLHGKIAKAQFPVGIAQFTLFNQQKQPLNERLVYIDGKENLKIDVVTDKSAYQTRDSIPLTVRVTDGSGKPVSGSFSLAVTDDNQVKADTMQNIISYTRLSSQLKGDVEEPWYYLERPGNEERKKALDVLLLTQGWRGYSWQKILSPPEKPVYAAEKELEVNGTVRGLSKPLINSKVTLISTGKTRLFRDTVTNNAGAFRFARFPPVDTVGFVVQAKKPKGGNFGVEVTVNEFRPAAVVKKTETAIMPWYVNSDSTVLKYVNKTRQRQEAGAPQGQGRILNQVVITAKRVVKESKNLNGPGEADQIMDEKDIEKAGKNTTLLQLLEQQNFKGFHIGTFPPDAPARERIQTYMIRDKKLGLVIDGVNVDFLYTPSDDDHLDADSDPEYFIFMQNWLNRYMAEDIKGIELMYRTRFSENYRSTFLDVGHQLNVQRDYVYLEVTTWSGKGPFVSRTPGVYVYKPLPLTWPKQFYKPRYARNKAGKLPDLRSTIHWQPNILTNNQGEARAWFYSADTPGTYSLIIQGADMRGSVGYKKQKLTIKAAK